MQDYKEILTEFELGKNVIHRAGSKKLLLERTHTENAFHTTATIRKKSKAKRNKTSWLMLLLYLMAGLFIGAEIYLYLIKPG